MNAVELVRGLRRQYRIDCAWAALWLTLLVAVAIAWCAGIDAADAEDKGVIAALFATTCIAVAALVAAGGDALQTAVDRRRDLRTALDAFREAEAALNDKGSLSFRIKTPVGTINGTVTADDLDAILDRHPAGGAR